MHYTIASSVWAARSLVPCIYIIVSHSSALQCFTVPWVITKLYVLPYPVAIHKTITKILDKILGHFWLDKMHGIEQNRNGSKFTFTAHVFHAGFVCNSYWLQAEFWFIDTKRIGFQWQSDQFNQAIFRTAAAWQFTAIDRYYIVIIHCIPSKYSLLGFRYFQLPGLTQNILTIKDTILSNN